MVMRSVCHLKRHCIPLPVFGTFVPLSLFRLSLQHPSFFSVSAAKWRKGAYLLPSNHLGIVDEFKTYIDQKDLPKAMERLDSMQKHKLWAPNPITYSELVKCCIAHGAIAEGKRVHQHVFSNGYQPKNFLINKLLDMYAKFNLLDEAQMLFGQMLQRDAVSWNTMIAAFSSNTDHNQKALEMLIRMLRDGVKPDDYTCSSVLKACNALSDLLSLHCAIIKFGLNIYPSVRSSLINIYSKFGELQTALRIFSEVVTGEIDVWNSIICGFVLNDEAYEAVNLFIKMLRSGLRGDKATLASVLRACTSLGLLKLGRQVHARVMKFDRGIILDSAVIDMYCKCGSVEEAERIFSEMDEKNVISWSSLIIGFAQNGYGRRALELFEAMIASGMKPDYITITGVLFACSHAGLVEEGQYYFKSMKRLFGIEPGREHYGCMIDLLGRAGKLEAAMKLIRETKFEPDAGGLSSLCHNHVDIDLAESSAKKLLDLDPYDPGNYILLSNIYAKTGRWKDAAKLRRSMQDRGIKKKAGCSWIEIDKQIHVFVSADKFHLEIDAIYEVLNVIFWGLKERGHVPDSYLLLQNLER